MPQRIVIVEILVPERYPIHPLFDERLHRVFDQPRIPVIDETPGQTLQNVGSLFHLAQQKATSIGADPPPIKPPYHPPSSKTVKFHLPPVTLCFHKAVLVIAHNMLIPHILCHGVRPFSWLSVRNSG